MDAPPNTPHGIVQAENQDAVDALQRLASAREGLARLYDEQPILSQPDAAGARQLLDALPAFWAAPGSTGAETHRAELGDHLARVMREAATLRRLDGTLREDAASLAMRITATSSAPLPAGIHVRELMFGDASHAGSLIVLDDGSPDLALLFTARGGWEAFDSLDRLLETTRRRLLESVSAAEGAGMDGDAFAEAKARNVVGSRVLDGFIFDTLATRMIEVQGTRIAIAADDYALDSDAPDAATVLGDRIRDELSPKAMVDVDAIEHLREARLLEAAVTTRLANVPVAAREAWYQARDAYNEALTAAALARMGTGIQPPLSLHAYASHELAIRLAALGIDESPETITVEIGRVGALPNALAVIDPLPGSSETRRIPLVDLAAQNLGRFSIETLHAVDEQGQSMAGRLNARTIRDMVRDLDLANRYQTHLEQSLREGPIGTLARKLTLKLQAAHMRMEAAEARLSYFLPDQPRSFIDDREERGFRWVEAALDAPAARRHVYGHEIVASQLTYRQAALDGIVLFASGAPASASRVVMYTPGAPDGLVFREFESRQDAAKKFLYHPAFREYLLDRLPAEFASVSPNGQTRRFAGDRLAHWVLGASTNAAYTLTAEPFGERPISGDFLAADYDATMEKFRRNTQFLARSTAHADHDALLGMLQASFSNTPVKPLSSLVADIPASLSRMMQASWRFYDHVKAGDTGEAVIAFTEGYVNALNLAVPPLVGGRHIAGALVRSRSAASGVVSTPVRLAPTRVRFEGRYAARHLKKAGRPDDEGIFRYRGDSFVEQDGTYFFVRYDNDYRRWRLAPARGAADTRFTGPMIERQDGRWIYAHGVGLCGGMRRFCERMNRVVLGDDPPAGAAPAAPNAPPAAVAAGPQDRVAALMAPYHDEVNAVLDANPSASAFLRTDGSHLKFVVRRRSALILDPSVHPDIAELSAHQRRVFLHELDTQFPLRAERAEVLGIGGWAQSGGRRVPSRPGSPGPHGDIQSPDISSSTGDPTPAMPAMTTSQQTRWNEALTVARGTPRSAPRSPIGAAGAIEPAVDVLPITELVPPAQWPERLWYFSDRPFAAEFWPGAASEGVTLRNHIGSLGDVAGARTYTYALSALPPEMPIQRLSEVLGTSPVHQLGQRDPLGYALQIDMARIRDARPWRNATGVRRHEFDFDIRRRVLPNGEYQYFLQSLGPVHFPSRYIINAGRRAANPSPLPPLRH